MESVDIWSGKGEILRGQKLKNQTDRINYGRDPTVPLDVDDPYQLTKMDMLRFVLKHFSTFLSALLRLSSRSHLQSFQTPFPSYVSSVEMIKSI